MIFAQIKDQVIVNTILLNDYSLLSKFLYDPMTEEPYDEVLQVDTVYPQPGIGWTFDGIQFYPPIPPNDPSDEEI